MNVNEDAIGKKGRLRWMGKKREGEKRGTKWMEGDFRRGYADKSGQEREDAERAKGAKRRRVTKKGGGARGRS